MNLAAPALSALDDLSLVAPQDMLRQCELLCQAGSIRVDGPDCLVTPSEGLVTLLGLDPDQPPQPLAAIAWIPAAERRLLTHLWRNASVGTPFDIRHDVLTADGRQLNVVHRGQLLSDGAQGRHGYAILHDETERRSNALRLQELTDANETTGLPNRNWLLRRLDVAVKASSWDPRLFSVLSVEIPRITELASSMGFGAADALATAMAARLNGARLDDELVAQLGTAEFALMVRHPRDLDDASLRERADALIALLTTPVLLGRMSVLPTCRIGVARFPDDGEDGIRVLEAAQTARAEAGNARPVSFHTQASAERALRTLNLESELRDALEKGELALHYQPQVCLQSGLVIGCEALLRWIRPDGQSIPPDEFLPVAERSGLVAPIGEWAIREACRQSVAWREVGIEGLRIGINLSPVQFQVGDVETQLRATLQDSGARPEDIGLELTESALLHDGQRVSDTLRQMRDLGIEIALDDFGTGFSSLGRLRDLPIDVLKIDRSFIRDLTDSGESASLVRSIVNLAHGLKIRVLAEGVETEGQLSMLVAAGCDRIQGFLFSRALPADEFEALLRAGQRLAPEQTQAHARRRTLLLVDDEANILSSLKRVFRRDGYQVLTANSGMEALDLLATTEVDVIVSDQRMPGMAGVDFLRKAKELWPNTIRMTLSGFTDLQSIIDAVNEGAVFKFLTKPWDDERLREHVAQAFRQKELGDENRRLHQQVASANIEQASLNRRMSALLTQQREHVELAQASASGVRELLEMMPAAVLGLDPEGTLAYVNQRACELFPTAQADLGNLPAAAIDEVLRALRERGCDGHLLQIGGQHWRGWLRQIEGHELQRGDLAVLMPSSCDGCPP